MPKELAADLETVLATLATLFADEGKAREVAVLALSKASIDQTGFDEWNGGTYTYKIYLEVPASLYAQLGQERETVEDKLAEKARPLLKLYPATILGGFTLVSELMPDVNWREKAKAWVSGQGVTNQGRVRSDNIAPRECDGLLFRSQPEIHLYRALKSLGVSFAPLPVFVRGGESYRRIEPDFILLKNGEMMVVEVDGDTVHQETPVEAHNRTTMLVHEGAYVERVSASECETPEKAKQCAARLMSIIEKLKKNR